MSHSLSSSETTNSSLKASSSTVGGAGDTLGLPETPETNGNLLTSTNGRNHHTNTNTSSTNTTGHLPFSISLVQESSATKKGVLWEQQQNRFFFNRWKERYFILTTDYLTCFKKGSKKSYVGTEMGTFVYKINLNEVKSLTWVDKKKNGVIGVQLANTALFLWNDSERLLDDWMVSLQESTSKTKVRREALRKSATLLTTTPSSFFLSTSSPSHLLTSRDVNLIERKNSPNLFFSHTNNHKNNRLSTPTSDQEHQQLRHFNVTNGDETPPPPPPPPPRRYMRCFSTDIATLGDNNNSRRMMSSSPRGSRLGHHNPPPVPPHHGSSNSSFINGNNGMSNGNLHFETSVVPRKLSSASSVQHSLGPMASQSLRCKSSYALQLSPLMLNGNSNANNNINTNSPTLFAQHQQRRATAKRLSTISGGTYATNGYLNHHQSTNPRPQSQTVFFSALAASVSASSGDRADSDFTFIPSKSISIKPQSNNSKAFESTVPRHSSSFANSSSNNSSFSTAPKNAHLLPQQGPHRNMLTSSASLVLNSRRRQQYQHQHSQQSSWAELERKTHLATPPPVPPHRTHLHHF